MNDKIKISAQREMCSSNALILLVSDNFVFTDELQRVCILTIFHQHLCIIYDKTVTMNEGYFLATCL